MWEFPCVELNSSFACDDPTTALNFLQPLPEGQHWKYLGMVSHQFSHLNHTYEVYYLNAPLKPAVLIGDHKWVDSSQLLESAICTSVKKVGGT